LYRNVPALLFTDHALREVEQDRMDQLSTMLGVMWTKEQAEALKQRGGPRRDPREQPRDRLFVPLLAGFKPEILDYVKKSFGSSTGIDAPGWYDPENGVVEAFEMPRDEFIQLASMFTSLIPSPNR